MDQNAAGENHNIRALPQRHGLANGQLASLRIDLGIALTSHADVLHPRAILALAQDANEHGGVGNIDHSGAGNGPVKRHVLKGHVSPAVHGGGDSWVGSDYGDVVFRVASRKEKLVVAAAGGKGSEGMHHRLEARSGQAAGHADHVGLSNAAVDRAVWIGSGPLGGADAVHQVSIQIDKVRVLRSQGRDGLPQHALAEAGIHAAVIYDLHASTSQACFSASNALVQRSYCSSLTGRLWFITFSATSCTPAPFTVSSTMA